MCPPSDYPRGPPVDLLFRRLVDRTCEDRCKRRPAPEHITEALGVAAGCVLATVNNAFHLFVRRVGLTAEAPSRFSFRGAQIARANAYVSIHRIDPRSHVDQRANDEIARRKIDRGGDGALVPSLERNTPR